MSYPYRKRTEAAKEVSRRLSREAKRRRRGICEDCGGETRYHGRGGINGPAQHCHSCAAKRTGAKLSGIGPVQQRLYALLDSGVSRYMEIRDKLGVTDDRMGSLLDRELHAGRIERVSRGHYRRVV